MYIKISQLTNNNDRKLYYSPIIIRSVLGSTLCKKIRLLLHILVLIQLLKTRTNLCISLTVPKQLVYDSNNLILLHMPSKRSPTLHPPDNTFSISTNIRIPKFVIYVKRIIVLKLFFVTFLYIVVGSNAISITGFQRKQIPIVPSEVDLPLP